MSLFQRGLIIIGIVLLFQIAIESTLVALHEQILIETNEIHQWLKFANASTKALAILFQMRETIAKQRQYTSNLNPLAMQFMAQFREAQSAQLDSIKNRRELFSESTENLARATAILNHAQATDLRAKQEQLWKPVNQIGTLVKKETNSLIELMMAERGNLDRAIAEQTQQRQLTAILLALAIAAQVLITVVSIVLFRVNMSSKIHTIVDKIRLVSEGKSIAGQPRIGGKDEIAALDRMFVNVADSLREATQNEKDLIQKQRDFICALDEDLQLKELNQACSIYGYNSTDLLDQNLSLLIEGTDDHVLSTNFARARQGQSVKFETKLRRKNGTTSDVLCAVSWSEIDRCYFCVFHDISGRKQAEQLRQEVLQMVSHDLRSPLTTVTGFLELVDAFSELSPAGNEACRTGIAASHRMLRLVNDFLKLERIKAGNREMIITEESIQDVVEEAAEKASELCDVQIDVQASNARSCVDRVFLEGAIIDALCIGAERFSSPLAVSVNAGENVIIQIQPKGMPNCGITPSYRYSSRLTMPLCIAVLGLHGGQLTVDESSLQLTLPLRQLERNA